MKYNVQHISSRGFRWFLATILSLALAVAPTTMAFAQATSTDSTSTTSNISTTTDNTSTTTDATTNATSTETGATSTPVTIMIMPHVCTGVMNSSDFTNIQNGGSSTTTADMLTGFGRAEWACPTTGLPGNTASSGTKSSPRSTFDFTITDENGHTKTLSDATFMPGQVCESTLNVDFDNNGTISPSTCLDASSYTFSGLTGNQFTVTETNPPTGEHFGTVLFTPTSLDGNNDMQSLVSQTIDSNAGTGTVVLDTSSDTNHSIMLHVFNFADTATTTNNTPPMIVLNGSSTMTITQGSTFVDPGAMATDNEDGNLTSHIIVSGGPVNTSQVGTTTLTYMVTDSDGMTAQVTRTVVVTASNNTGGGGNNTAPTITLLGPNPLVLTVGQTFTDPGATANDLENGNLTGSIVETGGPVNTSVVGTTTLTYTVTDSGGLSASVSRTVIVNSLGTSGGTTSTTTGLSSDTINAFVNIVQRVEDIQSQILNLLDKFISR